MAELPSSIETHLRESGFSATELLIVRHIVAGDALTLRELAAKTGKSTGTLDQAAKKLLRKKILRKQMINKKPKYTLASPGTLGDWVKNDMRQKLKVIKRKQQDVDQFIQALCDEKERPAMEYFEGQEGIEQAYLKLLEHADREILRWLPVTCKEEDDPHRSFQVEYFRKRRKQGIFERILTHDTPHGRRFQSRDVFEYRETVLVPEDRYPCTFEQALTGSKLMVFDHGQQKAYSIDFPVYVEAEKQLFESTWRYGKERAGEKEAAVKSEGPTVPATTAALSSLREFFISKKTVWALGVCILFLVSGIWTVYLQNYKSHLEKAREKAMAIAATAAPEIDGDKVNLIREWKDAYRTEYKELVLQLQDIRSRNPSVEYAYILRPTDNKYYYAFVADADSMNIHDDMDFNSDGVKNDILAPGYLFYDYLPNDSVLSQALNTPTADKEPYHDLWGSWIAGHAAIKDSNDFPVAVIGVDIDAADLNKVAFRSIKMWFFITSFFGFLIILRLAFR